MKSRPPVLWLRKHGFALRLLGCFLLVTLASAFVNFFNRGQNGIGADLIWVSNGVLLVYLLLAPRWHWPAFLCAGLAAQIVGGILIDGRLLLMSVDLSLLNLCEVLIAALLLRRRSTELPRFTDGSYLLRFFSYAILTAPVITAAVYALLAKLTGYEAPRAAFLSWTVANSLGTAVATPAFVAIFRAHFRVTLQWRRYWVYPAALVAATVAAFSRANVPLILLVYPLLVLILLHLELAWSTIALLFVAVASGFLNHFGMGPFAALASLGTADPGVLLQLFVATGMFILYSVSAVLERQKDTERQLQEIAAVHTLVTENSRDVIILSDLNGRCRFVSVAARSVSGWKPEELMNQGSMDLIYPDDLPRAHAIADELRSGAEEATLEARIRKVNGDYIWVEACLRVVRDPETGAPSGLLNTIRDISERKQTEQKLQEAYNAVEALSVTDALTGLANRRRFDQYISSEWRRSMRDHQPFSLLMIDADMFKAYNDTYGHQRGDSCLKQIAESCMDVVSRPGDLVARFGGEEFVVILPNTVNEGAMRVAEEICEALRGRQLPHTGNSHGIVTISIGCATMVPKFGKYATDLIELADQALYKAKHNGRNLVCNGNLLSTGGEKAKAAKTTPDNTAS
jgi:diguanylate cyclase (GGDEF)-like protein/PAS domain S-box-containing protein